MCKGRLFINQNETVPLVCSDGVVTNGWLCVEDANEVVIFDVGFVVVKEVVVIDNVGDNDSVEDGVEGVVIFDVGLIIVVEVVVIDNVGEAEVASKDGDGVVIFVENKAV